MRIPQVALHNADFRFMEFIDYEEYISLERRDSIFTVEPNDPPVFIHSPTTKIELPKVVMLRVYSSKPSKPVRDTCTNREVLRRDNFTCAYCGEEATTWDHVLPQSRGGGDLWLNTVAACQPCNNFKANRTPEEAGMHLRWQPYNPGDRSRK